MVPKVSIIVLTWNGEQYILSCLKSVLSQDYPEFEVIVVDNASTDGTVGIVVRQFPQVKLIQNTKNMGYAGGNNVGLRVATGDVLVLLNQDTEVNDNWLTELVKPMLSDASVGITGGKALYPDGMIQHAGGYIDEHGEGHHFGYRQTDGDQFNQSCDVDYVTGAGLAITRETYNAIGELDESFYPAYYEDVDWCFSARRAGFRVVYIPKAVFLHKEKDLQIDSAHNDFYFPHRNRIRFVFKHWSLEQLLEQFLPTERIWLCNLVPGGEKLVAAMHHVYLYHLLYLSNVMTLRQTTLNVLSEEAEDLASILLDLRMSTSASSLLYNQRHKSNSQVTSPSVTFLNDLHQSQTLKPHQFQSDIPLIGSLITGFRRLWYQMAAQWSERTLINQQNAVNAQVVASLVVQERELHIQRDKIIDMENALFEYVAENEREINELALELVELKKTVQKQVQDI